jgi:hypothetical protein
MVKLLNIVFVETRILNSYLEILYKKQCCPDFLWNTGFPQEKSIVI